jgi:hypothetical protein
VRTDGTFNAYKTCGHVATMQLQYHAGPVDHSEGIATVPGDPTGRRHTMDWAQRGRMTRYDILHVVEDIIYEF